MEGGAEGRRGIQAGVGRLLGMGTAPNAETTPHTPPDHSRPIPGDSGRHIKGEKIDEAAKRFGKKAAPRVMSKTPLQSYQAMVDKREKHEKRMKEQKEKERRESIDKALKRKANFGENNTNNKRNKFQRGRGQYPSRPNFRGGRGSRGGFRANNVEGCDVNEDHYGFNDGHRGRALNSVAERNPRPVGQRPLSRSNPAELRLQPANPFWNGQSSIPASEYFRREEEESHRRKMEAIAREEREERERSTREAANTESRGLLSHAMHRRPDDRKEEPRNN